MKKKKRLGWIRWALAFLLGLFAFCGCSQDQSQLLSLTGKTMGTRYHVKYWSTTKTPDRRVLVKLVEETLKEVNRQMSTYQKDSEISVFNSHRLLNWVDISKDFYTVLSYSLSLAKKTNGAFDPTIGPLVNLWGFGSGGEKIVPTKRRLEEVRKLIGYDKVELSREGRRVRKKVPGVFVDLSASAKGFGVDKIAALLETYGVKNYLVEIGGEVKVKGRKGQRTWKVAIESPHPKKLGGDYQKVLEIKDKAVATSGDYRHYFEEKGKKYSHTINFRTGRPVDHRLASVTVVDLVSCLRADALATALMVMGPEKGFEFAERENLIAYFIYRERTKKSSEEVAFIARGTRLFNKLYGGGQ